MHNHMLLFNRDSSWLKAVIALSLLATSTLLYADKPYKVDNDGDPTSCTISPAASTINQGDEISFSSTNSGFKGKKTYAWVFAGGSPESSKDESVRVTYNTAGDFNVSLTVSGRGASSSTCNATVQVASTEPPVEPPTGGHADITVYEGPQTCIACHKDEAEQMHGSVHYQQSGPTDFVTNIDGPAGERGPGEIGINTYCGTHENSPRFTCAGCHVGNGRFALPETDFLALTDPDAQESQLANIDCLTCHQEVYKRFPDGEYGFEDLVLENLQLDGNGKLVRKDCTNGTPSKDCTVTRTGAQGIPLVSATTGDFLFEPADSEHPMIGSTPLMDSRHDAARNVHKTTRQSCLNCHAKAGGGNGTKRGDFDLSWANPTVQQDVHMSPDSNGQNLRCADCHDAGGHRMFGRGLDLRPNDVPLDDPGAPAAGQQFSCESCHDTPPHSDSVTNTHAERVACQTCHIPSYAKGFLTEVNRDWEDPHPSDAACNGRGGWLPREDKETNLTPTYAWYDGTSEVYVLGETVTDNVPMKDGAYVLGAPNGDVASDGAKIHPMKEHTSKLALHNDKDVFIGHSTFEFFRTGSFDAAVQSGLSQTEGMQEGDDYTVTPVHTYQTLNHGVEPSDNALGCGSCHASLSRSGTVRMDLQGDLGYGLKDNENVVCTQCHEYKPSKGFEENHGKHVKDKRKDCSVCHTFSRPERGLSTSIDYED